MILKNFDAEGKICKSLENTYKTVLFIKVKTIFERFLACN